MKEIIPIERIENRIMLIRGQKIILDKELAELYGVSTKVFNQAVKRNLKRFPKRFMFQLNNDEKRELVTNCDRFSRLKHSSSLPYAFTEHGALMSANVLNSERAISVSILIVEAFVRMRELIINNAELAENISNLEKRLDTHDEIIVDIIIKLKSLLDPETNNKPKIGFNSNTEEE
jgi:hypothetical protein